MFKLYGNKRKLKLKLSELMIEYSEKHFGKTNNEQYAAECDIDLLIRTIETL